MNIVENYTIRRAGKGDAAELARLLTSLGHPTTPESISEKWALWQGEGNVALVAERDNGTLAASLTLHHMLVLHRAHPVGRITSMIVDETDRGAGLGRTLVAAAEEIFTEWGCGIFEVTSNLSREGAHAFYQGLGYERTSLRFAKTGH